MHGTQYVAIKPDNQQNITARNTGQQHGANGNGAATKTPGKPAALTEKPEK